MRKQFDKSQKIVFGRPPPKPPMSYQEANELVERFKAGEQIEESDVKAAMMVLLDQHAELSAQ